MGTVPGRFRAVPDCESILPKKSSHEPTRRGSSAPFLRMKNSRWERGFAVAGVMPLLLYIAFGPADANPIGLGLLAVFAVPVGAEGAVIGSIKMLVERFTRRGR